MDPSNQIGRLMSNIRYIAVTLPASLSQLICLIPRCCISAPGNGLVSLDLRKPFTLAVFEWAHMN